MFPKTLGLLKITIKSVNPDPGANKKVQKMTVYRRSRISLKDAKIFYANWQQFNPKLVELSEATFECEMN